MPSLEAAAVAVRLRRLWLGEIAASDELADSDLADAWQDVTLRRVGSRLELWTPYDFGAGTPLAGPFGDLLRTRVAELSKGTVTIVDWRFDPYPTPPRRAKTTDLDIYAPGDPMMIEYGGVLAALRYHLGDCTSERAREAVGRLRLVAVSRHRLWFAAPSHRELDALGAVPGARAALVKAVQAVQKDDRPLYRVVVDSTYRKSMLV